MVFSHSHPSRRGKALLLLLLVSSWLLVPAGVATATILFSDGFESGSLLPEWSISGTNQWQVQVRSDFSPPTGAKHLIFDDSTDDSIYSVAEATLTLDLSYKKNVILTFTAKSLGNEPHSPPPFTFFTGNRAYDGVAISVDNGASWRAVQSLANVGTSATIYQVTLDPIVAALGGTFGPNVRIRFSEYDNSPAPIDGIAVDDIVVTGDDDPQSRLEMPSPLLENSGSHTGQVFLSFAPSSDFPLTLVASPSGQLNLPQTVVIPAGQMSAPFIFDVVNDETVNLTRAISVSATGNGLTAKPATVTIYDDEAPTVTIAPPAEVYEGVSLRTSNATITLSRPADTYFTLYLTSDPPGQLQVYSSVFFSAGQTQASFLVNAEDDSYFDGDVTATITASAPGIPSGSATTIAKDNDRHEIILHLPTTLQEGSAMPGSVQLGGSLPSDSLVHLTSSNPAIAHVPATVVMPAGNIFATFDVTAGENAAVDGSRSVTITASADAFTSTSAPIIVRDNEVAGYLVAAASDVVNPAVPVSFTVSGADNEGNRILDGSGIVNVEIVQANGTSQPASPPMITLTGTTTTGTTTLPPGLLPPLRIRVTDAAGKTGESAPFDFLRSVDLTTADLVWDSTRQRIYASIPSDAPSHANEVVALNPITGEITGSASTGQNPGQLALTEGGEALYVALNANGSVARIDPTTMSVVSTFSLGTNTSGNTLFAKDLAIVRSDPNLLVVLRDDVNQFTKSLTVFENGVARPNTIQAITVEPSAAPDIVYASASLSSGGLARVQVDQNGLAVVDSNPVYLGANLTSDGHTLADRSGHLFDGTTLRLVGNFFPPQTFNLAAVRPDVAAQRVFFITSSNGSSFAFDEIAAFDLSNLALARTLRMPAVDSAASLIRWGVSGLAFRTSSTVVLLDGAAIVPRNAPTDLSVTVQANLTAADPGEPVDYTVQLRNQGAAAARNAIVTAKLSPGQTFLSVMPGSGTASISEGILSWRLGDVTAGAVHSLTIKTRPEAAGSAFCTASVASETLDPNSSNDAAFRLVPIGFRSAQEVVNTVGLRANNILFDPARQVVWVSLDRSLPAPLDRSIVAIDPRTGEVSDPILLDGNPLDRSMALSGNGRYLYVGYSDAPAVGRVDLGAPTPELTRITFAALSFANPLYPQDLKVLEGDGTSFIVTSQSAGVAVYDGEVRRPDVLTIYAADQIEKTPASNVFVGFRDNGSPQHLRRLLVSGSGVSVAQESPNVLTGQQIEASANLVVSNEGFLANSQTLTRQGDFGMRGTPCIDVPNKRAYFAYGYRLQAFDLVSGAPVDSLLIQTIENYQWARRLIRWGVDGFAMNGPEQVYLTRWSAAIPSDVDQDGDHVSDAWEARYFGTLDSDLSVDSDGDGIADIFEYFFGTSPRTANGSQMQFRLEDTPAGQVMHLVYNRRADLAPLSFTYETSTALPQWTPASGFTESIIGMQTVDGILLHTIDASIVAPNDIRSFARLRWLAP